MAGPRLKLVRDAGGVIRDRTSNGWMGGASRESGSFKFPGSVRDVLDKPDPRRMTADDVALLAERSLRQMQSQLDMLKREAGGLGLVPAGDLPDRAA